MSDPGMTTKLSGGVAMSSLKVDGKDSKSSTLSDSRIHSGAFMVSHFNDENEIENQDYADPVNQMDDDDDDGAENALSVLKIPGPSSGVVCMELEKYKPEDKRICEIDSDLSQVFNTLNVTYKQKLTSPKWNPFKGIRLRWKEKIRLNNVIWRCWHMQFILKKKPFVCQFASPLDVDIHNTPQAIILEGKYWKRKGKVITAEYKKWRRFNVNKNLGTSNLLDTRSEFDALEWANDMFSLSDCDTLFSTVSQIPFPDHREISRAGRADFIQPSLGPLQPNFEDFMDFDIDLLNSWSNNRLAPVPEEQTEEILRAIEFPMMNSTSMGTSSIINTASTGASTNQTQNMNDGSLSSANSSIMYTATITSQDLSQPQINQTQALISQSSELNQAMMDPNEQSMMSAHDDVEKDYRGKFTQRIWKSNLSKRGPHNYDKCVPTANQTTIYNQMLAQQQHHQQQANSQAFSSPSNMYNDQQSNISHISPIQTTTNNFNSPGMTNSSVMSQNVQNLSPIQMSMEPQMSSSSHQSYKSSQGSNFRYHGTQHGSQPYKIPNQNQSEFGMSTSRLQMRQPSPPHQVGGSKVNYAQQAPSSASIKEMYRSNSLPINPNLQLPSTKDVDFAMPKYPQMNLQTKERRSSLRHPLPIAPPMLQTANSEPSLNVNTSALAQLLTNSQSSLLTNAANSQSISSIGHHQQPVRANSFTSASLIQNQISMAVKSLTPSTLSSLQQHQQQQPTASGSSSTPFTYTPTLSPDSAYQDSHDISSPERKMHPRDSQRRAGHIHAEQKRRYNIKNGFDMLHSLIPQLQQNPNAKLSKASMLQKGAEYIKQLRMERTQLSEQMDGLRKEIDTLTNSLNHLQSALPANGASNVSRQRNGRVKEMYQEFVTQRTLQNWKYWIFGQIFEPLLHSYYGTVSTVNYDELCRTSMLWVDNSCGLVEVRPAVSNKLREISTTTDILSDNPTSLQEEVLKAMQKQNSNRVAHDSNRS